MPSPHGRALLACSTIAAVLAATAWATNASADMPTDPGGSGSSSASASASATPSPGSSDSASPSPSSSASSSDSASPSSTASTVGERPYIVTVADGAQATVSNAVAVSGGEVTMTYDKAMDGLAVSMTPLEASLLKMRSDVTAVELDQPITLDSANDDVAGTAVLTDAGCLTNSLSRNDDFGTVSVALPTTVNWFGNSYSGILINNNGGLSFDDGLGAFTSYNNVNIDTTTRPLVLPLFTDLDTTNVATTVVQYGPLANTFGGRTGYCINWVNVGHYNASGPVYSAQALIINRDDRRVGDVDVVFNYNTISVSTYQLEIGIANPGDRTKSVRVAGSGTTPTTFVDGGSAARTAGQLNPGSFYTAKNGRYVYQVVNTASPSATPTPTPSASCSTSVPAGTQGCATWGLDRIDQLTSALNQLFTPAGSGIGVTAYIVDTGLYAAHSEFTGRVGTGRNFTVSPDDANTADCHGHGTHVAGTVAGTTYGVAKLATIIPVKVLDCYGSGSTSGVIAGLDWVIANHAAGVPAALNMSLGGGYSAAMNLAVANVVADGVTVAVAAGNETQDACNVSPASEPTAITVGATTSGDAIAYFSNYGSCVDILAPGYGITSAGITSTTSTATMSGTSMASPHVAGAAAVYLGLHTGATPAQVVAALTGSATIGVVSGLPAATPNLLLNVRTFAASSTPTPTPAAGGGGGGGGGGGSSGGGSSEGGGGGSEHEITSVQPASGPLAGGNTISVVGFGFTGASSAFIGGKAASFRVVNDARVDIVVPPGNAMGSADVSIVLSAAIGRAFAPGGYVYVAQSTSAAPAVGTPANQAATGSTVVASTPPLVVANPQFLTASQVASFTPAQIATIPGSVLAQFSVAAIAALTPEQAAALTVAQLASLRPKQAAALDADALASLTPAQFAGFRPASVAKLSPSAIADLTAEQLAGLRPTAFAWLTRTQTAQLAADQVAELTPGQVSRIRPSSLAKLDPDALAAMSNAQLAALTAAQVAALTPQQRAALTPQQRRLLG
ncbi:MAG: S8 family serine peptidase [Actinobacteria bacterium]|nr:S8 family serine peptidase [Actinomycetota bacterium]